MPGGDIIAELPHIRLLRGGLAPQLDRLSHKALADRPLAEIPPLLLSTLTQYSFLCLTLQPFASELCDQGFRK